jgi:hypothetical protein
LLTESAWSWKPAATRPATDALWNLAPAEPDEITHGDEAWARVTANKQIFLNVWGNVLFGYVGVHEGISASKLQTLTDALGETGIDPTFIDPGNHAERQMGFDWRSTPLRADPWRASSSVNSA